MQMPPDRSDDPMPEQEPLPENQSAPNLSQEPASPDMRSIFKKWPLVVEICIVAAILVAIGGWSIPRLAARFASPPPIAKVTVTGTPYDCGDATTSSSAPIGVPAIQPHLSGVPAFTEDDVREYVSARPFNGHRFESKGPVTITRILFITSYDACQLMRGESVGLPNDAIVCYVQLSGTFLFSSPFSTTPQPPLHTGEEVFDGKTGNLLVLGVR